MFYDIDFWSIGFAIAQRFLKEGAKVVISSRKQANVEKAVEQLKSENCHGLVCHVAKKEDRINLINEVLLERKENFQNFRIIFLILFKKTVKKYGGIDIFVSNAATNPSFGPLFDVC